VSTVALVHARRSDGQVWPLLDQALACTDSFDLLRLGIR
jgi:hypothetical protein